jgi:hypothetical protein
MSSENVFQIFLKGNTLVVLFNNNLLYMSKMNNIIKSMASINTSLSFDLFVFSDILEYNDEILNYSFEFSKEFLDFAKECNNGRQNKCRSAGI